MINTLYVLSSFLALSNTVRPFFPCFLILLFIFAVGGAVGQTEPPLSYHEGKLIYSPNEKGDRVPDFSYSGYKASEQPIPSVPIKVVVSPDGKDATARIQAALDYVGKLPMDRQGFKGAVLLEKGLFPIEGQLQLNRSGVVLRGSGTGEAGTVLLGTGQMRETLISIRGKDDRVLEDTLFIADPYVPVNGNQFQLAGKKTLATGTEVLVVRPATHEWIDKLGMREFGGETGWIGWKPGDHTIHWDRTIAAVTAGQVILDVPITTALDSRYGGGY